MTRFHGHYERGIWMTPPDSLQGEINDLPVPGTTNTYEGWFLPIVGTSFAVGEQGELHIAGSFRQIQIIEVDNERIRFRTC